MAKFYLNLVALPLAALVDCCYAQKLPDSTAYNATLNYYIEKSAEQSEVFSGNEYIDIRADIGSIYFNDNKEWTAATLVYNGNVYKNVPVLYDAFSDLLISRRLNSPVKYSLISEKIQSFQLEQHRFVRVVAADVRNAVKDQFYEELYGGKSQVIVKRSKIRSEVVTKTEGLKIAFENDDVVYVKKDSLFYPVKSRGDLLKLFNDKEDAMKAYIKTASLNFGKDREEAIVKSANYYDQISL